MNKNEIDLYINELKSGNLDFDELPDSVKNDNKFIEIERKKGLRTFSYRGFDILKNKFFVEEELSTDYCESNITTNFDSFSDYFNYVGGDIYNNACYMFYDFSKDIIKKYSLDVDEIKRNDSLIDEDYTGAVLKYSNNEIYEYEEVEKEKRIVLKYLDRFKKCKNRKELRKLHKTYENSDLPMLTDLITLSFVGDEYNEKRADIFIDTLINDGLTNTSEYFESLFRMYPKEKIKKIINKYNDSLPSRHQKYINRFMEDSLIEAELDNDNQKYFDNLSHFFVINKNNRNFYYVDFDEFAHELNYDLSDCNLEYYYELSIDLKKYKINKNTYLPISYYKNTSTHIIEKGFDNNLFFAKHIWKQDDRIIKESVRYFNYLFDFCHYLKNNLNNVDLIMCDGIENIDKKYSEIFKGSKLRSVCYEKLGISYKRADISYNKNLDFSQTKSNEKKNTKLQEIEKYEISRNEIAENIINARYGRISEFYYISDIHLMHRLVNNKCRCDEDIKYVLTKICESILDEIGDGLLIAGDVSSDYGLFSKFLIIFDRIYRNNHFISKRIANHNNPKVFFVLGNHEFWDSRFIGKDVEHVIRTYKNLMKKYPYMRLLYNEVVIYDIDGNCRIISGDDIDKLSDNDVRLTWLSILGGTGYSGFSEKFNANNGIYRTFKMTHEEEKNESSNFNIIYKNTLNKFKGKNIIVFSHTPKDCWSDNAMYDSGVIYVNGHTHLNYFHDDGDERIYSDNQIGYKGKDVCTKYFLIDSSYDYFADYSDGIYEISRDDYINFNRAKQITLTFKREYYKLYMLKKNDYYCFITETKNHSMSILNGGALKSIGKHNIQYYYDNMDGVISIINKPLVKYQNYQLLLAKEIKKIGGLGRIHGCIIDIDWENHIYVNPIDLKVTGYNALDMVYKYAYPDIPSLLEDKCPKLFEEYRKSIGLDNKMELTLAKQNSLIKKPTFYPSTDIYDASRKIKKMQKLNDHILTYWTEVPNTSLVGEKKKSISFKNR